MECRQCEICGAKWIGNQLYWSTGKQGRDIDLAALVCNQLPKEKKSKCANPKLGTEGGVGWAERLKLIESQTDL
jgi:hypothetical protein